MSEIDIVQGKIEFAGKVHGAINTIVTFFAHKEEWFFKQFVSQEELEQYARENQLQIVLRNSDAL